MADDHVTAADAPPLDIAAELRRIALVMLDLDRSFEDNDWAILLNHAADEIDAQQAELLAASERAAIADAPNIAAIRDWWDESSEPIDTDYDALKATGQEHVTILLGYIRRLESRAAAAEELRSELAEYEEWYATLNMGQTKAQEPRHTDENQV